jgi:hypothetical protein
VPDTDKISLPKIHTRALIWSSRKKMMDCLRVSLAGNWQSIEQPLKGPTFTRTIEEKLWLEQYGGVQLSRCPVIGTIQAPSFANLDLAALRCCQRENRIEGRHPRFLKSGVNDLER